VPRGLSDTSFGLVWAVAVTDVQEISVVLGGSEFVSGYLVLLPTSLVMNRPRDASESLQRQLSMD